jgi:hypothetical protein
LPIGNEKRRSVQLQLLYRRTLGSARLCEIADVVFRRTGFVLQHPLENTCLSIAGSLLYYFLSTLRYPLCRGEDPGCNQMCW